MTTFLLQCLVCLVAWMTVGVVLALRARHNLVPAPASSRGRRSLTAIWLYLLSALVLLGGLFGVLAQHGIQNRILVPWAWAMVAVIGLVFVMLQLRATILIWTLVIKPTEENPTP